MNIINNTEDILKWAEETVAAKGEKFSHLSKADQFAIAEYIVNGEVNAEATPVDEAKPAADEPEAIAEAAQEAAVDEDSKKPNPTGDSTSGGKHTTTATMMRGYALHMEGYTVQQAYDEFLKWCKGHPKESTVMDFSTGVKSNNAAFAYWLAEIISVEVPTTTTARI
jgi:hypothetical protein